MNYGCPEHRQPALVATGKRADHSVAASRVAQTQPPLQPQKEGCAQAGRCPRQGSPQAPGLGAPANGSAGKQICLGGNGRTHAQEHDPQRLGHCGRTRRDGCSKGRPEPGDIGHRPWVVHFAISLQSAGNWWRMGGRSDPQAQTQPAMSQMLACGQEAALAANALLRTMRAPGEQGHGVSACGVALGLGINIRPGTGRDGGSFSP